MTKRTGLPGRPRLFASARPISVKLPLQMIAEIDSVATEDFCRRTDAIRLLLERGLEAHGRPVARERNGKEAVEGRPMCYVTLTIDHRVLDGYQANAFLTRWVEEIERWS